MFIPGLFLGKPVSPDLFVGRLDLIEDIENLVTYGHNIDLIGPHQTGKTALCYYLQKKWNDEEIIHSIIVDLQHLPSPRFSLAVSEITEEELSPIPIKNNTGHIGADNKAVNLLINYLKEIKLPIAIYLDEMDSAYSTADLYSEWQANLRYFMRASINIEDFKVSFIKVLRMPEYKYSLKYFPHISAAGGNILNMSQLTNGESINFIKDRLPGISNRDIEFVSKFAGNYPFMLETMIFYMGSFLIENKEVNYKDILFRSYTQFEHFFEDLYNYVLQMDNSIRSFIGSVFATAFIDVTKINSSYTPKIKGKFALDDLIFLQLEKMGIVIGDRNNPTIFSPLFSWWLTGKSLEVLKENEQVSEGMKTFLGVQNLKDLLSLIKNSLSITGGIAALI